MVIKSSDVQELNTATSSFNYDLVFICHILAVTLPLPSDQSVPSDGIVPSKNLCHWFKERILRVSRGVQTPSGERSVRRLDGADDGGLGHAKAHKIAAERDCGGRSARPGH